VSHLGTGPVAMFPVGLRAFGRMVGCGVMDSCGQRCGIPRDSAGNRPRAPAGVGSRPVGRTPKHSRLLSTGAATEVRPLEPAQGEPASDKAEPERTLHLLTVGHSTATSGELAGLLEGAGVELVVDVRSVPGSRRHPQFSRAELEVWMPNAGIDYRWEPDLGGFRRTTADSPNVALRHPSFRGYADYMATDRFEQALERLLADASRQEIAVMCAETLWWRCHRRLIADAATLLFGADVRHLSHDGRISTHRLTDGVRLDGRGGIVYDAGQARLDPGASPGSTDWPPSS